MPLFDYKAVDPNGVLRKGRIDAKHGESAMQSLRRQGHLPVEVTPVVDRRPWWRFESTTASRRDRRDVALATRELSVLLQAGQTVEQALQLLSGLTGPERLRAVFGIALERLREGRSLADSLAAAGGFPTLYIAMVRAGEASGGLEGQLAQLADMLERNNRLKDSLVSAMLYPIVLLCVAVAAVLLLLGYVVPQFAPLFATSPRALPIVTRAVLAASAAMRQQGPVVALALALLAVFALPAVKRPAVQDRLSGWALRLPLVGGVLVMAATARLARALGVLLKGGVALPNALLLSRDVTGNPVLARLIDRLRSGIKDGKTLAASLPPHHPLPPLAVQLLTVGEQSGRLEDVLLSLADIFDNKVETSLKRSLAIFEPACILFLSLLIGTIVVSILMAVVSINDLAI